MEQKPASPSSSELSSIEEPVGGVEQSPREDSRESFGAGESSYEEVAESEPKNAPYVDAPAVDAPFAAEGTRVDMDDALAKARAIAAKLGSMQRPSVEEPREVRDQRDPRDMREQRDVRDVRDERDQRDREPREFRDPRDDRRSASPSHSRSKRSRSPDRSNRRDNRRRFDDSDLRPVLTFSVPTQLSGLIIGRNGNNLRSLEQQHGVRIQFDSSADKRSPERQITIEGPVGNAENARREILEFIDRHANEQKQPGGPMGGQGGPGGPGGPGGQGGVTIMVPGSKVGLIIGRGGESIRDIQFSSGASVQVQPDNGRSEREIVLLGAPDQIEQARARIMDIVSAEGPREQRGGYGQQPRGQHVEEFQVPSDSVGIVIGRGGETIKFLQQDTGTRIQVLQGPQYSGPMRPVTISGDYAACMRARGMIEEKLDGAQERQRPGQGSGGYEMPQRGPQRGQYGGQERQWGQQGQQAYGQQPDAGQYGSHQGYQQQHHQQHQQHQQQHSGAEQTQWTNQQAADYYSQYAAGNPEYGQYADYYRSLAAKDPHGIVPSGN
ncbi:hypothetical protein LPJ77_003466 [Coemansia sp. RSA 2523]|nr:hypothetical protein LPJ54_000034 [Coemansia sp. RSA 1824]KAJ1806692.1 hypothetical protein LPJ77_003466 [Coemansia sp. RSA 2523]KAJ2258099.1 hypothetical protein GGH98_000401 [Coemansia sp. RSA 454]KAJ2430376.1 hypothetical protein GGF47_000065 [Coemansia sp. RSA 2524]